MVRTLSRPGLLVEMLNPPTMPPPVSKVYNQIAVVTAGRLAFIAGQVAIDRDGQLVGAGDYGLQAEQTFRNLAGALKALDAKPSQVARMTINVVGHRPELRSIIFAAGYKVFGTQWPACASTLLGVHSLALPEWLIEVDATVALPGSV
jgi:enamine deaminase RidA (YjgF/YER057c/UK114 family)